MRWNKEALYSVVAPEFLKRKSTRGGSGGDYCEDSSSGEILSKQRRYVHTDGCEDDEQ